MSNRIIVGLAVGAFVLTGCSSSDHQTEARSTPSASPTSLAQSQASKAATAKAEATARARTVAIVAAKARAAVHAKTVAHARAVAQAKAVAAERARQDAALAKAQRDAAAQAQAVADAKAAKKAKVVKRPSSTKCRSLAEVAAGVPGAVDCIGIAQENAAMAMKDAKYHCHPGDEMLKTGCWDSRWPQRKWRATHPGQPFPG